MVDSLPRKADVYFLKQFIGPNWDSSNVVGFDPNSTSGDLRAADSFNKLGDTYPQFTIQTTGEESSGGESSYDYITSTGPGQNRVGTLTAQVRVEDKSDSDEGYVGDSTQFSEVSAERLATLIGQEIERICLDNPTGGSTEFHFVGANTNHVPDQLSSTQPIRREGVTISYGWLRD